MRTLRAAFIEAVQTKDFTRFKFANETSTNLTYCRFATYLQQVLGPALVAGRLSNSLKPAGPACCTCRRNRQISTPLDSPLASSNLAAHGPGPHSRRPGGGYPNRHRMGDRSRRKKLV